MWGSLLQTRKEVRLATSGGTWNPLQPWFCVFGGVTDPTETLTRAPAPCTCKPYSAFHFQEVRAVLLFENTGTSPITEITARPDFLFPLCLAFLAPSLPKKEQNILFLFFTPLQLSLKCWRRCCLSWGQITFPSSPADLPFGGFLPRPPGTGMK